MALDGADRGVGQRRAIGEQQGRHGVVAVIDAADERRRFIIGLDVDLVHRDPRTIHLGLEAEAEPAPGRGEHGDGGMFGQVRGSVGHGDDCAGAVGAAPPRPCA